MNRIGSRMRDHEQKKLDTKIEIIPEKFFIVETLDSFDMNVVGEDNRWTGFELDVFQAANLRNRLTAWMNNKKRRDMQATKEEKNGS